MAKGQPNGLATLDGDGKLSPEQIPHGPRVNNAPDLESEEIESGTVTKERYNALRADLEATRSTLNDVLASLRKSGIVAS